MKRYDKFLFFIKSFFLGILTVCLLIFNDNLERIVIFLVTLTIVSIIKAIKINTKYICIMIIGIIMGFILFDFLVFFWIIDFDEYIYQEQKSSIDSNQCAVLIISNGEPEIFDYQLLFKRLYSNHNLTKLLFAPVEIFKIKLAYEKQGKSMYIDLVNEIKETLQNRLGPEYVVYSSYLNTSPLFDREISRLSEIYNKIIIVPLFLSETIEYKDIKKVINNSSNSNIIMRVMPLLWKSEKLNKQLVKKASKMTEEKNLTGIIILEKDKYSNKVQTNIFVNKLIKNLEKAGFDNKKIIYINSDKYGNLLNKSISSIQENGVNKIIIISISDIIDDIKTQTYIKNLLSKISKNEGMDILYIYGWGVDDNLFDELEYKIRLFNLKN